MLNLPLNSGIKVRLIKDLHLCNFPAISKSRDQEIKRRLEYVVADEMPKSSQGLSKIKEES